MDDLVGEADEAEARTVGGCDLEPVEEGGGALAFEVAGGESVDDDGERDLDGFAVFDLGVERLSTV